MQTLQDLKNAVEGTRDLSSIARAMKALAAVRIRQSQKAVRSLRSYADAVEKGFQILLKREPRRAGTLTEPSEGRTVSVVMGSDLGMVGGFNRQVADFLAQEGEDPSREVLVAVGLRVVAELERTGRRVEERFPMPDTVEAMPERIQDLVVALDTLRQEHAPDRVVVVYQHYRSGSDFEPRMDQLLPLDPVWLGELARKPWSNRRLPGFQAPVEVLVSSLVREHLFLSLFRAMAESHASENASRLRAMEAAERRIQDRLESLTGRLKQQRKQEMTEELLDIMAGTAALEEEEEG